MLGGWPSYLAQYDPVVQGRQAVLGQGYDVLQQQQPGLGYAQVGGQLGGRALAHGGNPLGGLTPPAPAPPPLPPPPNLGADALMAFGTPTGATPLLEAGSALPVGAPTAAAPSLGSTLGSAAGFASKALGPASTVLGAVQGVKAAKEGGDVLDELRQIPNAEAGPLRQQIGERAAASVAPKLASGAVSGLAAGAPLGPPGMLIGALFGGAASASGDAATAQRAIGSKEALKAGGEALGRGVATVLQPHLLLSKDWREKLKELF